MHEPSEGGRSREKFTSPDCITSPNHAYLKKKTGALGYLFCAYWATNGGLQRVFEGKVQIT